ncbi:lytic transglycosylase domain-containing protein [Cereibacter sphaeroides]|uniref:Lytic transglycosylase domain-containing protein n=1 Tax=Cereibacter sphaeroides TaxID=1063 RepID=A0AAX1UNL5_CERSP|nr:transglycosylase SLT domain-containing protein [Cereibacter sphaeroides]RHZ96976.1 lytic transglycosylase domain-containing protein [Cereibacter sphaeroides]
MVPSSRLRAIVSAALMGLASMLHVSPASARLRDADLCEEAARRAARATGVPQEVLMAITLTETGRRTGGGPMRPWPWAVNVAGQGHWFPSRAEAEQFVASVLDQGRGNFDVGCFQLNNRWHAENFASMHDMFDPDANALYAARYLQDLRGLSDDWSSAAGAYHSATPELARRYRSRFEMLLADLPAAAAEGVVARVNAFPLFRAGDVRSTGSLVPLDAPARPLFGD